MIVAVGVTAALAVPPVGQAEVVFDYAARIGPAATALDASLVVAGGEVWIAVEWSPDAADPALPGVDLFHAGPAGPARRTLLTRGEPSLARHYPSIATDRASAEVHVTAKQDLAPGESDAAEIVFFAVDRDAVATAPVREMRLPEDQLGAQHHGMVHLVQAGGAVYGCWTRTAGDEVDDLWSKAIPEGGDWSEGPLQPVAATAETDDHCEQVIVPDGRRLTVYHSVADGTHDVWLGIDAFTEERWTSPQALRLPLEGLQGINFPSIAAGEAGDVIPLTVVAQGRRAPTLALWTCDLGPSACDTAAAWGEAALWPGLAAKIERPEAVAAGEDRFVIVEAVDGRARMALLAQCAGEDGFTLRGRLAGRGNADCAWSADGLAGTPAPQVAYDPSTDEVHASLVCAPEGPPPQRWVPVHWTMARTDVCR